MDLIDPDEALIRPLAANFANRFRMVEREDVAQEMRVWWLSHQRQIKRFLDADEAAKITVSLKRVAQKYCEKEKARTLGYETQDLHFYDSGTIRDLLPMVWDSSLIIQDQRPDDTGKPRNRKPANEGNNLLAMVSDISRALTKLPLEEYSLLWLQFGEPRYSNQDVANHLDTTLAAAKMRVQRAINQVVDILGGANPFTSLEGPGSRRAQSNASAQSLTSKQEDGN